MPSLGALIGTCNSGTCRAIRPQIAADLLRSRELKFDQLVEPYPSHLGSHLSGRFRIADSGPGASAELVCSVSSAAGRPCAHRQGDNDMFGRSTI
jgi:hypothetical protein